MKKLYPLTRSPARLLAQSIYFIFSAHRPKTKTRIIKNTILNFSIFIYNLSMWLSEQVYACVCWLACRHVFACSTCTCTPRIIVLQFLLSFFIEVCPFVRSVRMYTVEWIVSCCDCLCVPHSFVIRQIFGDFPREKEKTSLSRAFEKLSFSNKFLGLAVNCTMSETVSLSLYLCWFCMSVNVICHMSASSHVRYTYHHQVFLNSNAFRFAHTLQSESFYREQQSIWTFVETDLANGSQCVARCDGIIH